MSLLHLVTSDGVLKIENRKVSRSREMLQTVTILLRTYSPYDDVIHSLEELLGQGDADEMQSDIKMRFKNIESILQSDYDVSRLVMLNLKKEGQQYVIDILIEYNDNSIEEGKVYA